MTYRYLQGIDYGPRDGTLGLSFHMSEGYDGLPPYLARKAGETTLAWVNRVSGVSCHVAITSNGTVWQMLGWDRASGNLNPADRAAEYGYYGGSHLRAVLGTGWTNPNAWTLSCELAGFRSVGPTDAQVAAAIKWGREMKALFPTLRGATGHHDQSPKPCPGLTPNMKAIFTGLGGHGLWNKEANVPGLRLTDHQPALGFARVKPGLVGVQAVQTADLERFGIAAGQGKPVIAKARLLDNPLGKDADFSMDRHTVYVIGGPGIEEAVILAAQVDFEPAPDFTPYGAAYVAAAIEADRARARVTWEETP